MLYQQSLTISYLVLLFIIMTPFGKYPLDENFKLFFYSIFKESVKF